MGSGAVVLIAWIYSLVSQTHGWPAMPPEVAAALGGGVISFIHILEKQIGVDLTPDDGHDVTKESQAA